MTSLEVVTREFGLAYSGAKQAEAAKTKAQRAFFDACTRALSESTLGQRLVVVDTREIENVPEYVEIQCPGYTYVSHTDEHILVQEDPAVMKFQFINEDDGYVYGRTNSEGAPSLDDERLRAEDPALWDEISAWAEPWYSMFKEVLKTWLPLVSELEIELYLDEYLAKAGLLKTITDPNSWTEDTVEKVSQYMVPGKITVKLVPPRKAKPEELGEV
jgi:hypothetical protein